MQTKALVVIVGSTLALLAATSLVRKPERYKIRGAVSMWESPGEGEWGEWTRDRRRVFIEDAFEKILNGYDTEPEIVEEFARELYRALDAAGVDPNGLKPLYGVAWEHLRAGLTGDGRVLRRVTWPE